MAPRRCRWHQRERGRHHANGLAARGGGRRRRGGSCKERPPRRRKGWWQRRRPTLSARRWESTTMSRRARADTRPLRPTCDLRRRGEPIKAAAQAEVAKVNRRDRARSRREVALRAARRCPDILQRISIRFSPRRFLAQCAAVSYPSVQRAGDEKARPRAARK